MAKRTARNDAWTRLALMGALTAVVVVMAVTTFTLQKSSSLIAGRPQITEAQPATTGQGDVAPQGSLSGSERSIEGSPEPRARERLFVPVPPAQRNSTSVP